MGICGGFVGPKSGHVEKVFVFKAFWEGQGSHEGARESLQSSEPERWEAVGGGKPSPLGLVLEVLREVLRVCGLWVHLHAWRPEASADFYSLTASLRE